jgi:hypothetical protein
MSSFNTSYGQKTFIPTVYSSNAGLSLGSGDDFLDPNTISNASSGYSGSIKPISSTSRYILNPGNFLSHNASPDEVLIKSSNYALGISPITSRNPYNLVSVPNVSDPYYQGVPDLGINPNPVLILSGTTQFQNQLVTEGAPARPGFPVIDLGINSSPLDYMGKTQSFIGSMIPNHPMYGNPVVYPTTSGGALYYPPPPVYNPNPYQGGYFPAPQYPPYCPPPFPQYPPPYCPPASQPLPSTSQLTSILRNNAYKLPDFIPTNVAGGVTNFIQKFNSASESKRIQIRQDLANVTTVNEAILNSTGITGSGGLYGQGKVTNPFVQSGFLTDSNPFARFRSGIVVTNGNDNGKIKGTVAKDSLIGTAGRNNIFDGQGGEDDVVGSSKQDLVNVHFGDRTFTDAGDDLMFFNFTEAVTSNCRLSVIDGGVGKDTLVLRTGGNPSTDAGSPRFTNLSDGSISVTMNNVQVITRNIEKFIVVDQNGNIGATYKPTAIANQN